MNTVCVCVRCGNDVTINHLFCSYCGPEELKFESLKIVVVLFLFFAFGIDRTTIQNLCMEKVKMRYYFFVLQMEICFETYHQCNLTLLK